ncbi:MAG: beta-lactamase family protein [Lachnospiraceae bacterium]|nr:beta-lactamase family protein [Lachnospiraceae bacterium]
MYNMQERIATIINQEIEAGEIAGANIMVLHKGKEIFFDCYGYADKENKCPVKRDTIFRLFSMSKPITAVATMILVERGEIDVRDAVSKYIPAFAGQKVWCDGKEVPAERDITVWDCLNMTTGIPYPDLSFESGRQMDELFKELIARRENGEVVTTMDYVNRIAQIPLAFQPGERWMYGLSADILGAVIEAVSGKKYSKFLQDEIFLPLGMKDTGFYVPADKEWRFAKNYDMVNGELVPFTRSHLGEYYKQDVAFESGGAGMVSTIEDYSHFTQMLVNGGTYNGVRILGRKTVAYMAQNHLRPEQMGALNWDSNLGCGYGCLMRVLINQSAAGTNGSLGEFGWDGWTGNYMTVDPSEELTILYFIQRCGAGFTPAMRKLRSVIYGSINE